MNADTERQLNSVRAAGSRPDLLLALSDERQGTAVAAAARQAQISFCAAAHADEALAAWDRHRPAILMAGALPDLAGGLGLVQEIRRRAGSDFSSVIIFLGGDEEVWIAAQAAGAEQCLPASSSERLLATALAAALRRATSCRSTATALRRAESMAEAVSEGVVTIAADGVIRWVNPAAAAMFGYERAEMLGRNVSMLAAEPHGSAHDGYLRRYAETGVGHVFGACLELEGRRKDGSSVMLELSVSEVREAGAPHFVGILRDVSRRKAADAELQEKAARLELLRAQHETENDFAREVVERLLGSHGREDRLLRHHVAPAEDFSGDVVAVLRSSEGRLYVMLADATGHGLAAAVSLVPAISVFYGMASRDLPLAEIVGEMNRKLRSSMPVGRFVAAALVCIDDVRRQGEVWIGGTPDLLWLDAYGRVVQRFPSSRMALGILESTLQYAQPETFAWHEAGQLFVCSDGVLEAQDRSGELFGTERLLAALAGCAAEERIAAVKLALETHLRDGVQLDDVSLLSIDLPV